MRVTILGLNFAPETTGIAPYTSALASDLARTENDVRVVTTYPHYPAWRRDKQADLHAGTPQNPRLSVKRCAHYVPNPPRGLRRVLSEVSYGLRAVLSGWHRPDTILIVSPALFASAIVALRALLYRRAHRVAWVQDLYTVGLAETSGASRRTIRIMAFIEGWTLRRCHTVVTIDEAMSRQIVAQLRMPESRVQVIKNWTHITTRSTSQEEARRTLGWPTNAFIGLHAGNMGVKQGLRTVLDSAEIAAQSAPSLAFYFVGDGAERHSLEEQAHDATNVSFVDPLPEDTFPLALVAADALLVNELPGVREMATPSKLTSYLVAGRPVVACVDPNGIVARIIGESRAGLVVPSGDGAALASALDDLRRDPDRAKALGLNAARYAQHKFGARDALAQWSEALKRDVTRV
ncbi:glycosyltransferase family 4 protein [Demequina sp. B12]|uniref:glycosyltransferase family 4 protein n=1 Tax=Demequina sp. B12 TaxID=2992757 RepID=UPI00237B4D3C|nr:glycosyltransferase family 4 protein [Demequina sp. B12]MDE0573649.1 glycosyltransferase family 4 protein [Demequina sp. B12]